MAWVYESMNYITVSRDKRKGSSGRFEMSKGNGRAIADGGIPCAIS